VIEKMSRELTKLSFQVSFSAQSQSSKPMSDEAITEAIDYILSTLGNTNKQTIYCLLDNKYGIKKEEIPHKIGEFSDAIEQTFGSVAKLIELKIIERLHFKYRDFSYVPINGELDFGEFVSNLQRYLES
jgi:hypothetical protein